MRQLAQLPLVADLARSLDAVGSVPQRAGVVVVVAEAGASPWQYRLAGVSPYASDHQAQLSSAAPVLKV